MKHQKETNGGVSTGPIVINADPSMANALGNSPHFMNVNPSAKPSFTVPPAIASEPKPSPTSQTKTSSLEISSSSGSGSGSVERIRPSNQFSSQSKEHHHSKEVSEEKSYKKSGESGERRKNEKSSEERVIEKVITEEK
jgi:hypothetical protein